MNAFIAVLCLAAVANAGLISHDIHGWNAAAHIPSGSISVGHDGAVIAGPSGSVHTNNGLHGHGAGARLSGPAGEVGTHGGLARLAGPGLSHSTHIVAAPVAHAIAAPVWAGPVATHAALVGSSAHATIVGPSSHATIVGPSAHATIVGPSAHSAIVSPLAHSWGHAAVVAAPAWGHSGVIAHGLVGHGHHGW